MKLEQSFEVAAPLDAVWSALIDVERVAPCLPGAEISGRNDDGSYEGSFSVKIGPTSASYRGRLHMEHIDENAHVATMRAHGTDKRGQGGAKATIVSTLHPSDGGTHVEVVTDYSITGRLARFGRGGMIEDISNRLLRDFAQCLQSSLAAPAPQTPQPAAAIASSAAHDNGSEGEPSAVATAARTEAPPRADAPPAPAPAAAWTPPPASQPIEGIPLLLSILKDRLVRALRAVPAPVLAAAGGALVLALLLRSRR
jgi:carbon monoxide dehydrogenase subunit G